ncbi:MAG TPA: FAD-dependent oxidoreductase, partial [Myxococcota bacterium]
MPRDPRYDPLFEAVRIGPVTAPNRFYQVPHCSGMGHLRPRAEAAMRAVKAEGGWGVVCTPMCEIHPSAEVAPYSEARLWDDRDIPALSAMTEAVHSHGALAGVELAYSGHAAANRFSREVSMGASHLVSDSYDPVQARAMTKRDIKAVRDWHRAAALRARKAGFDIVYVYAGHALALPMHFIARRFNQRSDEYGGSVENRTRFLRELIEDTRDAVGDTCAVAVRLAVDELLGSEGIRADVEAREVLELLGELPDLWDVNLSNWANDSVTSRFAPEGFQEQHVAFVKSLTSKPVVGVGRFTTPDAMLSQVRRGVLDFIGAARPSIADPYLPRKIDEGRGDDIRECIGCNICVSGDFACTPMRCTQNPTMGEEWRRGWHPERVDPRGSSRGVLVVGAGPAGLECARILGQRGYPVTLADARDGPGGRVSLESRLPGLAAWARVRDYRVQQLRAMDNVHVYPASTMSADDVRAVGAPRVVIATGARWRRDGVGRWHRLAVPGAQSANVYTADDVLAGTPVPDPVLIFDDDHYYLGGVIAEMLRAGGSRVTLATPAADVSHWTHNTLEQGRIQRRLLELEVDIRTHRALHALGEEGA